MHTSVQYALTLVSLLCMSCVIACKCRECFVKPTNFIHFTLVIANILLTMSVPSVGEASHKHST